MELRDAPVVGFHHRDLVTCHVHLLALLWEVSKEVGDVATDGGHFIVFNRDVGEFIEFVKIESASGGELVFAVDEFKLGGLGLVEFVLDIAHDFFHDVIKGDDADGTAVFIDGEGEVGVGFAEAMQQFVDGQHLWHH